MSKNIKFNVKISVDGKEQLVVATADVGKLRQAVANTDTTTRRLRDSLLVFNQLSTTFGNIASSVSALSGMMTQLSTTYNNVQQANTQLTTVMQQRMNATEADIDKVKEVISVQSQLGVVSGTAQKIGAQQVATFLKQKGTLEVLIPAMNNLIAQQRGVNATQEDARSIANLMGKAMTGQTSALRRVGITFTEAQERILKYGDEQQRAAMLAEIITNNVGNMNEQLGRTDAGKIKHVEMQFAKIKIALGETISKLQPWVTFGAQALTIATSVSTLTASFMALGRSIAIASIATATITWAQKMWRVVCLTSAAITRTLHSAFTGASAGATTLKIALRGLMISSVIGIAVVALTAAIEYFVNKSEKAKIASANAANGLNLLKQNAQRTKQVFDQTSGETFANLMSGYSKLQAQWKALASNQKPGWIIKNREELARLGLHIKSVADAENVFVKNTGAVVDSFKARARAAARLAMLTEEYKIQMGLIDKLNEKNSEANKRHHVNVGDVVQGGSHSTQGGYEEVGPDGNWHYTEKGAARQNANTYFDNGAEAKAMRAALNASKARSARLEQQTAADAKRGYDITPGISDKTGKVKKKKEDKKALEGSLDWYEKKLTSLREKINATPNLDTAKQLQQQYKEAEAQMKDLKIKIGLEKPDEVQVQTYLGSLKKKLEDAQNSFESATTIEARVNAAANIANIQKQINESTSGKLTIPAEVTSSYAVQGSDTDKRQSYTNAQQRISQIKADVEIGLVDRGDAEKKIKDINDILQNIGLKPIKVELDTSDIDKKRQKMQAATDAAAQLGSGLSSLGNAVGSPELNIAGTMAQAVATMIQGFATASAQSASLGPWGWVAFSAMALAQLGAMVSSIKNMGSYATGGIIGGNSYSGDRLTANVNSGEMILNPHQQAQLFKIAQGKIRPLSVTPQPIILNTPNTARAGQMIGVYGNFGLSGRNLKAALKAENSISRRK